MSYTKGPLKVEVWGYSHDGIEKKEMVLVSPEVKVATLTWDGGKNNPFSIPEAETRANGALFAASHDMLEASEKMMAALRHVRDTNYDKWLQVVDNGLMDAWTKLSRAIAKAKGGQI